jgi:hypothetical protein
MSWFHFVSFIFNFQIFEEVVLNSSRSCHRVLPLQEHTFLTLSNILADRAIIPQANLKKTDKCMYLLNN